MKDQCSSIMSLGEFYQGGRHYAAYALDVVIPDILDWDDPFKNRTEILPFAMFCLERFRLFIGQEISQDD